jgi:hypothetical protein
MKNGKVTGHDGITPEMMKSLGENGTLLEIFRKAWAEGKIPQDWEIEYWYQYTVWKLLME